MTQDTGQGAATKAPNVHNGTYTISHPEHGHFTLKLYTATKGDLAGKRILSMLVGPDNETSYRGVAFWDDEKRAAFVWRRYKGPDSRQRVDAYNWQKRGWSRVEQKLAIWCDLVVRGDGTGESGRGFWAQEGYTLLLAGHCVVCNRRLTDPESIRLGIGPKCGGRS